MKIGWIVAAALVCAGLAAAAAPARGGTVLEVGPDQTLEGSVDGKPARFQMLANGSSTLVLNADAATRLGLRGGWIAVAIRVGPISTRGRTAVTRYAVGGQDVRHRVAWFDRPFAPGFDGALGPAAVPQPVVRFDLRAPAPGERRFTLPLVDHGYGGMGSEISVGGRMIFVEWALTKHHNGATAAAGANVAEAHGGQFSGQPWQEPLAYGIRRPVRRVILSRPLMIGPLALDSLVTRTTDYGDTSRIPDGDADASEIVVTGKGRKDKASYSLEIGTDALAACSSLTFDKPRRQIVLSCR